MGRIMLIIGMPKSASTSFAETLSIITNKKCQLIIPSKDKDIDCKGFVELPKCHCNMKERGPIFLNQIIQGKKTIFREHLLPTETHIKRVSKYKDPMILLLRKPDHVYDSYDRLFKKYNQSKINRRRLKKELIKYYNTWNNVNIDNLLKIDYNELILNYDETMKKVLNHIKCEGEIIPLLKKKYTGVGEKRLKNVDNSST
jgi:hypothetical protein